MDLVIRRYLLKELLDYEGNPVKVTENLDMVSMFAEGKGILFSKYLNVAKTLVVMFKCYGNTDSNKEELETG